MQNRYLLICMTLCLPGLGICRINPSLSYHSSALAWRHSFHGRCPLSLSHFRFPPTFINPTSQSHKDIMDVYVDSERPYSPTRRPTMIRRERREAKRRMVLLSLLACFLFLTLVAFRRPNSLMGDYTRQPANSTALAPSRTNAKGKSWFNGRPKSTGPVLSNSARRLPDSSLADLKNSSLGVRPRRLVEGEELLLTTLRSTVRKGLRPQYAITNRQT